jgi:hypothetical protein
MIADATDHSLRLTFRPVSLAVVEPAAEGRLVFAGDALVAVVSRFDADGAAASGGPWHLDAGFGPCEARAPDLFDTLDDLDAWIRRRIAVRRAGALA